MATKPELIKVAKALNINTEGLTKDELNDAINETKKALESITTSETADITRMSRFAWWCPHCDASMPNGGIDLQAEGRTVFLKGLSNPIDICTNCGAVKTEKDGKYIAVNTR